MTEAGFRLQKRALLLDFACIAVALVTLYLANKKLLPTWALIVGALIALVLLVISIVSLIKSRSIERKAMLRENDEAVAQAVEQDEEHSEQ